MKMAQIREVQRRLQAANDVLRRAEAGDLSGYQTFEQLKERVLADMEEAIRMLDDDPATSRAI